MYNLPLMRGRDMAPDDPVRSRPVIFCISSGRAGSGFLATLLNASPRCIARHEPWPRMIGSVLDEVILRGLEATPQRAAKNRAIARYLRNQPADTVYAELSHMFIKTFHDVVVDYFTNIRIVSLRRDLSQVLRSFVELGYFTSEDPHWPLWMHDPLVNSGLEGRWPGGAPDAIDRAIAYLFDIEARREHFEAGHPELVVRAQLDAITKPDGARHLFDALHLPWSAEAERVCGQRENTRQHLKRLRGRPISIQECADRIDRYREIVRPLEQSLSG